jgi:hypothetical protein
MIMRARNKHKLLQVCRIIRVSNVTVASHFTLPQPLRAKDFLALLPN